MLFGVGGGTSQAAAVPVDLDGDGWYDAHAVDQDGDGWFDATFHDFDGDGRFEVVWYDTDFDGFLESRFFDANRDGSYDVVEVDTNRDGHLDVLIDLLAGSRPSPTQLSTVSPIGAGAMISTPALDFDGDGVLDLFDAASTDWYYS